MCVHMVYPKNIFPPSAALPLSCDRQQYHHLKRVDAHVPDPAVKTLREQLGVLSQSGFSASSSSCLRSGGCFAARPCERTNVC